MLDALAPVALLIALGYGLRASAFLPEASWAPIDRLVYYILFPALLVDGLASADLRGLPVLRVTIVLLFTQLAMAALAAALRGPLRLSGPSYTSVLQCVVRWNSYVALALARSLFGPAGLPLTALAVAVMVPASNLLSIVALTRHGRDASGRAGSLVGTIATNPLILACALGVAINLAGWHLPKPLSEPLAILSHATMALGLLTVGAGLRPHLVTAQPLVIAVATAIQLLVKPAVAAGLGLALGLGATPLMVVILACAVPTATASYILARLLGGDAELMAALVTITTVAALLTLPLVLGLVRLAG
ncbi:AEC family transporter [Benzoatithermus flavus]|uniref:AEC family transporter n=1 Tax=Benzoatithermus flavus TaxID=3108223 RepID=A0ABU8XMR7_9PROT